MKSLPKIEKSTVTTVQILNQGEGLYTKEIRTVVEEVSLSSSGEITQQKKFLIRRIVLAKYRVVKRSEKYHLIHLNYTGKKIYLRRIS